ncbi:unnamed protein product [Blepharisma stoltei]|uniref:Phosphoribulokinase/uridine kinase domain-containing protein n=1 Tax=Blepharisma stoltei TaxID=1481888 RepID=A0AAU9IN52_9CILI|nr:unnamed protein product [Blepharisma stoltei]
MNFWELEIADEIPSILKNRELHGTTDIYYIGIVGYPGIGKTVSADFLKKEINSRLENLYPSPYVFTEFCKVIPMDGFHLYKYELDDMPNPKEMHFRRGAHFTFDPQNLYYKLSHLKLGNHPINFPSFSHTLDDPQEDTIQVDPNIVKVVIIEGLYLYCELPIWKEIREIIDYKIYIDGNLDEAMDRVVQRNARCLNMSLEETAYKVQHNDRLNAGVVEESRRYADKVFRYQEKPREILRLYE